ncbi:hypothetical protein PR048_001530 [Dryococelus australis]|uniref:Uncharacterized protein n=1 Tax=Dryococelus australis TaxID=614101 RepID=A0ABQ9IHQ0_9NEOP|nr:hypothetical protein PR048_001530 [Dryococelus australis]
MSVTHASSSTVSPISPALCCTDACSPQTSLSPALVTLLAHHFAVFAHLALTVAQLSNLSIHDWETHPLLGLSALSSLAQAGGVLALIRLEGLITLLCLDPTPPCIPKSATLKLSEGCRLVVSLHSGLFRLQGGSILFLSPHWKLLTFLSPWHEALEAAHFPGKGCTYSTKSCVRCELLSYGLEKGVHPPPPAEPSREEVRRRKETHVQECTLAMQMDLSVPHMFVHIAEQVPRSSAARPGTAACCCRMALDLRGWAAVGRSLQDYSGGWRPASPHHCLCYRDGSLHNSSPVWENMLTDAIHDDKGFVPGCKDERGSKHRFPDLYYAHRFELWKRIEQHWKARAGENQLTSSNVRHDSHMQKSRRNPAGNQTWYASMGGEQAKSGVVWVALNSEVLRTDEGEARWMWSSAKMQRWRKWEIPEKTSMTNESDEGIQIPFSEVVRGVSVAIVVPPAVVYRIKQEVRFKDGMLKSFSTPHKHRAKQQMKTNIDDFDIQRSSSDPFAQAHRCTYSCLHNSAMHWVAMHWAVTSYT